MKGEKFIDDISKAIRTLRRVHKYAEENVNDVMYLTMLSVDISNAILHLKTVKEHIMLKNKQKEKHKVKKRK